MHGEGVKGLMKRALKLPWNRCYAFTLFTLQQLSFVFTRSMRNKIVPFIKPLLYLVAFCYVHGHVKGRFRIFLVSSTHDREYSTHYFPPSVPVRAITLPLHEPYSKLSQWAISSLFSTPTGKSICPRCVV